jgi:7-keto-8-aminopelargonate synthetase-like enzyme
MGTFTKSFGSAGGYVAGSKKLIAYLRRHSPAHLYAASIAPGAAQQVRSALGFLAPLALGSRAWLPVLARCRTRPSTASDANPITSPHHRPPPRSSAPSS